MIVYSGNGQILICTSESEPELVKLWFTEGGRDLDEFDRETVGGPSAVVEISHRELRVDLHGGI